MTAPDPRRRGPGAPQVVRLDPGVTAQAVFDATMRFHHPALRAEWRDPGVAKQLDAVIALVLNGLRT